MHILHMHAEQVHVLLQMHTQRVHVGGPLDHQHTGQDAKRGEGEHRLSDEACHTAAHQIEPIEPILVARADAYRLHSLAPHCTRICIAGALALRQSLRRAAVARMWRGRGRRRRRGQRWHTVGGAAERSNQREFDRCLPQKAERCERGESKRDEPREGIDCCGAGGAARVTVDYRREADDVAHYHAQAKRGCQTMPDDARNDKARHQFLHAAACQQKGDVVYQLREKGGVPYRRNIGTD
mmetsp:Transcript_76940/g.152634  ORF Transcript_76940/g.152634 Transcript_76940/m.152634 type:complete len:239 (+) Transcript_76940:331-1047(+)